MPKSHQHHLWAHKQPPGGKTWLSDLCPVSTSNQDASVLTFWSVVEYQNNNGKVRGVQTRPRRNGARLECLDVSHSHCHSQPLGWGHTLRPAAGTTLSLLSGCWAQCVINVCFTGKQKVKRKKKLKSLRSNRDQLEQWNLLYMKSIELSLGLWFHADIRTPSMTGFFYCFASLLLDFISLEVVTSDGWQEVMVPLFLLDTLMHLSRPAGFGKKMISLCKMCAFFVKRHFRYFIFIFCAGLL